jgi:alpha-1,3-rhamnosyl/mannosyltransferase
MTSIAGDAAVLFDPQSDEAMERSLIRVLTDDLERERLRRVGPEQAGAFTWKRAAEITLSVLEKAAVAGRGA